MPLSITYQSHHGSKFNWWKDIDVHQSSVVTKQTYVDISGIVDHHFLNFLFIIYSCDQVYQCFSRKIEVEWTFDLVKEYELLDSTYSTEEVLRFLLLIWSSNEQPFTGPNQFLLDIDICPTNLENDWYISARA